MNSNRMALVAVLFVTGAAADRGRPGDREDRGQVAGDSSQ